MSTKKKFRLRSRFNQFRFRDHQFTNGLLETDDEKVVQEFQKQSFFGTGNDVWLDDTEETDRLVESTDKGGGDNANAQKPGSKK